MSTNRLLNDLAKAKGEQELYTHQSAQVLKALREMALVQCVESSNRIEGVTVAPDRLRPLVLGHARPKDRPEQEIIGYRRALIRTTFRRSWSSALEPPSARNRTEGNEGNEATSIRPECESAGFPPQQHFPWLRGLL